MCTSIRSERSVRREELEQVSRMRWDRVRGWDQMWGGLSHEEIEEAREAAWFEREAHRERERAERQLSRQKDSRRGRSPRSTGGGGGGAEGGGRSRSVTGGRRRPPRTARSVATELGVGLRLLEEARENHQRVLKELVGRRSEMGTVAQHLGITRAELNLLRQVLSGYVPEPKNRVAALVEKVAALRFAPAAKVRQVARIRSVADVEPVPVRAPTQVGSNVEKQLRSQARRLGVDVQTLHTARIVESRASEMVGPGNGRSERVAKRLGVDPAELKDLRRAFAGDWVTSLVQTRGVIRRVAALGRVEPPSPRS